MTSDDLYNLMYYQLGYTEDDFAEFIRVHCNETGASEKAIDMAYNAIQHINDTLPYRHDGYQYDQYSIGKIISIWLEISSILGMQEAHSDNGFMIFVSPIGTAYPSFRACIDFQYGNVKPVENYPKMIKNDTKISKIFKGSTSILGMYKGTVKIF